MPQVLSANSAIPAGLRRRAYDAAPIAGATKHAAGVLFVAPDGDILLLKRAGEPGKDNFVGHWALPGGGVEEGETPEQGALREAREEMGLDQIECEQLHDLDKVMTPNGMAFHTFGMQAPKKFGPKLNDEHLGYGWFAPDALPSPMHPAVEAMLKKEMAPELAGDSALAMALDRDSVREKDRDGRLRVAKTNISKANVCPYRGAEIPGFNELGLQPDRVYNLLRDPEELKKAAASLNGVPLLIKHVPVSAADHRPEEVVGSLGTDANFDGTYLTNSLFVNAQHAIDAIESGAQKEVSAGYHYKPDMTPGKFNGNDYDGVMRDIVFNHVALVEDGRAGPDVVVGDAALKEIDPMKTTRFAAALLRSTASHIAPMLAMDAKLTLPKELYASVTPKNFKDARPGIMAALRIGLDGKLRKGIALDASMKDLANVMDAFGGMEEEVPATDLDEPAAISPVPAEEPIAPAKTTFDAEPLKAFLKQSGMDDASIMKACDMLPKPAMDEDDDEAKKKKDAEEKAKLDAKDAEMKNMVSKPAMDEAIAVAVKATRANEQGIRTAIATVKPWIGELPATLAFDSGAEVYRHTLKALNVEGADKMHADALLPVLQNLPKPGDRVAKRDPALLAQDSSAIGKALKISPALANIQVV